jgi:uncharacterized protein (DUF427 family)
MKATLTGHVLADSSDIVDCKGYQYFPPSTVHLEWLEKTVRTEADLRCPHGVQFYDVVIDGERHARNAWVYESPRPEMAQVKDRFGFWKDVEVK